MAKHRRTSLLVVGVVALVACVIMALLWWSANTTPDTDKPTSRVVTTTVEKPSEVKPADDYVVADDEPLSIEIDSIGVRGYIQKVGVDQHQAVTAPDNIHLAGWFVNSVLPGKKGLTVIDGHEGGSTMDGIFKNLPHIKTGDDIVVTMGDGSTYTYEVFDVKVVSREQAAAILFDQNPKSTRGQLNLVTCTGIYNDTAQTYDKRAVVYASLQR